MIIKRDVDFTPKHQPRTLHIWLPEDYFDSDERYPVMYFFDGHNLFSDADATYGKSWGMADFLSGWEKPMIIVGIECSHEGHARLDEYCPYDNEGGFLGPIRGMGDETLRFMAYELKPMIDREYRTYPHREATAIGGSSMGGLMSVYAAVMFNEVFSKAACVSSAVLPFMEGLRQDFCRREISPDTRVWLSWGTEEFRADHGDPLRECTEQVAGNIAAKGADVRLFCQGGGHHCEADWEKQVPLFMDYLWMGR